MADRPTFSRRELELLNGALWRAQEWERESGDSLLPGEGFPQEVTPDMHRAMAESTRTAGRFARLRTKVQRLMDAQDRARARAVVRQNAHELRDTLRRLLKAAKEAKHE